MAPLELLLRWWIRICCVIDAQLCLAVRGGPRRLLREGSCPCWIMGPSRRPGGAMVHGECTGGRWRYGAWRPRCRTGSFTCHTSRIPITYAWFLWYQNLVCQIPGSGLHVCGNLQLLACACVCLAAANSVPHPSTWTRLELPFLKQIDICFLENQMSQVNSLLKRVVMFIWREPSSSRRLRVIFSVIHLIQWL